jgi:hypothetical protein
MRNATDSTLQRAAPWLVALALLALSLPSHAQWKWRDKDGRVTVSDRPPPREVADQDILSRPAAARRAALLPSAAAASAASAVADGKGPLDREVEARRRAAEQEQAAKTKADETRVAAQRAENCQRARAQISTLESGQRLARVNGKGEREMLDEKARADELAQARDAATANCR